MLQFTWEKSKGERLFCLVLACFICFPIRSVSSGFWPNFHRDVVGFLVRCRPLRPELA